MFRFENSEYLFSFICIPILVGLYFLFYYWTKRDVKRIGDAKLFQRLAPGLSWLRRNLKFLILLISLSFICLSWANPQWGNKKEKVKAQSSDIFIALDISQSMMSEDISPNRLERAKRLTKNIIQSLGGNRVGLIFFAGSAYLQMPLSSDLAAAELFIQSANTGQAGTQGTAITEAIDLAQRAFEDDKKYQRALIIVTDGEDHDGEAIAKAAEARENGLVTFTIGVGTEEGGFIPYKIGGREQYKKDQSGQPVKSKLNVQMIKDLADAGDGNYYLVQEGNKIIADLKSELERIEKMEVEQKSFTDYASYFQYFLGMGIFLLVLEYLTSNRSSGKSRKSIFEV